jgi:hypothetical protein
MRMRQWAAAMALCFIGVGSQLSAGELAGELIENLPDQIAFAAAPMEASPVPAPRPYVVRMPKLRWKNQSQGPAWTRAAMKAVLSHGQGLVETVPADINAWCPGYATQDANGRAAFWAGLLSTLSYHESTWRETAVGGGGQWFGLVQISPATARHNNCNAGTGEALKDGASNLSCAIRIMSRTVARDGVVSRNMQGVAADWGPFHSESKRTDMQRWVRAQPFCRPMLKSSPLPLPRPLTIAAEETAVSRPF